MQLHIDVPRASSSWKAQFSTRDADYRTPSPPLRAIVPLSPLRIPLQQDNLELSHKTKKRRLEPPSDAPRKRANTKIKSGERQPVEEHHHLTTGASSRLMDRQLSSSALDSLAALATSPSFSSVISSHDRPRHGSDQGRYWSSTASSMNPIAGAGIEVAETTDIFARRSYSETTAIRPTYNGLQSGDVWVPAYGSPFSPLQGSTSTRNANTSYATQKPIQNTSMMDAELLLGFALGSAAVAHPVMHSITHTQPERQASQLQPHRLTESDRNEPPALALDSVLGNVVTETRTSEQERITTNETLQGAVPVKSVDEDPQLPASVLGDDKTPAKLHDNGDSTIHEGHATIGIINPVTAGVDLTCSAESLNLPVNATALVEPTEFTVPSTASDTQLGTSRSEQLALDFTPLEKPLVEVCTNIEIVKAIPGVDNGVSGITNGDGVIEITSETVIAEAPTAESAPQPLHPTQSSEPTSLLAGGLKTPPAAKTSEAAPPVVEDSNNSSKMPPKPIINDLVEVRTAETNKADVCTSCHQSQHSSNNYHDLWIACTGCKSWFHGACVGFDTERKIKDVDKFYCEACEPRFGGTTFVRKSNRAHASVDYAGLNEGKIRTSVDVPDHHYITPIKEGKIQFQPESFPRMRPELITASYFERLSAMTEPIVIPAWMNPRPSAPGAVLDLTKEISTGTSGDDQVEWFSSDYEYDCVPDDGQDKLDMVIPQGLTVPYVAELYGPHERVEVIDVKSQEGGDKGWNMQQWSDYYEKEGVKPIHNVISLEVSDSKLGRLIRRPKVVRDLDLQDAVWPKEELAKGNFPKVQFYCLMSVADCYTDFHIDFGGSSVYYHILKGKKTFFFIPPKPKYLKQYEAWCLSQHQSTTWLGGETKECYRVDLSEGDTMLIPSGWIHAVWTPEKSLVIGGNFLTRMHYGMQIQVNEVEKNTKVNRKFRYPHFQKVLWYAVIQYLEQDPIPSTVVEQLCGGEQFVRETPVYYEFEPSVVKSSGPELFNARYYSQGEIEGLKDLLQYILRTVMISLGKVQGISKATQDAVNKSIPKAHGDPMDLARVFAIWVAWKRGNEQIPAWAYPNVEVGESALAVSEKKLSASALKRKERQAAHDVFMAGNDRRSSRNSAKSTPNKEQIIIPKVEAEVPEIREKETVDEQGKASPVGPRRLACDACRKRRMRCKHKGDGSFIAEGLQGFGIKQTKVPATDSYNESVLAVAPDIDSKTLDLFDAASISEQPQGLTLEAVVINNFTPAATSFTPILPKEDQSVDSIHMMPGEESLSASGKKSRSKACLECRKSKRRCVHDERGRVDPIKAQEQPVARGPSGGKRSRTESAGARAGTRKVKRFNTAAESGEVPGNIPSLDLEEGGFAQPLQDPSLPLYDSTFPPYENSPDPLHGAMNTVTSTRHAAVTASFMSPNRTEPADFACSSGDSRSPGAGLGLTTGSFSADAIDPRLEVQEAQMAVGVAPMGQSGPKLHDVYQNAVSGNVFENTLRNEGNDASMSRTPSLHIHTNGTESTIESKSNHSSPLTDIESTPVLEAHPMVHHSSEVTVKSESPQLRRQTPRQRQPVERLPDASDTITLDNSEVMEHADRQPSIPVSSRRATPASRKRTPQSVSAEFGRKDHTASPSIDNVTRFTTASSTEEVEDESVRLARELTEQDFGLRRRSK